MIPKSLANLVVDVLQHEGDGRKGAGLVPRAVASLPPSTFARTRGRGKIMERSTPNPRIIWEIR